MGSVDTLQLQGPGINPDLWLLSVQIFVSLPCVCVGFLLPSKSIQVGGLVTLNCDSKFCMCV